MPITWLELTKTVRENALCIEENSERLKRWLKMDANTRGRVLMELRHDLEDAMKAVKALEEIREPHA